MSIFLQKKRHTKRRFFHIVCSRYEKISVSGVGHERNVTGKVLMSSGVRVTQESRKPSPVITINRHIVSRGEEKKQKEMNPEFKARRWGDEVLYSLMNCFRKLLARYEKTANNYLALIHFACAVIVWRKLFPVHQK